MPYYLIILALIQGVTEFLPISSNAHLTIFEHFFGHLSASLNASLHLGTALSITAYFFKDFLKMALTRPFTNPIVIATIPAVVLGLFIKPIESGIFSISIISMTAAVALYICDRQPEESTHISSKQAFIIGLFQCLAFVPAMSRMGMTVSAGRLLKVSRVEATKFSLMLAAPVSFGAFILSAHKIHMDCAFLLITLIEALVGFITLDLVLHFVRRYTLTVFVLYRIIFGILLLLV